MPSGKRATIESIFSDIPELGYPPPMPQRRFPKPWTVDPMPNGYQVIDANGIVLAHVYGQPDGAIAVSKTRLSNDEARRISRLPELVELEQDRNKAKSRRQPKPLRFKPVTMLRVRAQHLKAKGTPSACVSEDHSFLSESRERIARCLSSVHALPGGLCRD